MKLSNAYEILVKDNTQAFVQTMGGEILTLAQYKKMVSWNFWAQVYPGSFNPLHDGHKDIFNLMKSTHSDRLFETSITRWDKPVLSHDDLENRLKQFVDYAPIIITNVARFVDKAGLLRRYFHSVRFHIGMDTLKRMFENDYGLLGFQGIHAEFVVHERIVNGTHETLSSFFASPESQPVNCVPGPPRDIKSMSISSTEIRNRQQSLPKKL
jgi:hypothetical protein